jgi:hypothetical protein
MATNEGLGLGTYIFGAAVLWFVFGGDDKAETNNVSSNLSTPAIEQNPQKVTLPSTKNITVRKQLETEVAALPKKVIQQSKTQLTITYQSKTMYVDASRLNVRNKASKQGKIIWTLKRDQQVQVTNKNGDWLFVEGARFKGWVFGTYLTNNPAPKQVNIPKKNRKKTAELSTAKIKQLLIRRSHAYYRGNCPCPYNITAAGRKCGGRSAWSRPGGQSPLCYPSDISQSMVAQYKARQ